MKLKLMIGLAISALFLYLTFRQVDYRALFVALKSADYLALVPAALALYSVYVLRAGRWFFLLRPIKKTGFYNLMSATSIGFMANFVLPARAGEFIRAYQIGRLEGISKPAAFATVVVERLLDGLTLLVFLVVVINSVRAGRDHSPFLTALEWAGWLSLAMYLTFAVVLILLKTRAALTTKWLRWLFRFLPGPWLEAGLGIILRFTDGIILVKSPWQLSLIVLSSLAMWLLNGVCVYFFGLAFGVSLSAAGSLLVLVALTFGIMLPSAPGFVGTYHAAFVYTFMFFGISKEPAVSAALVSHAVQVLVATSLGVFFLAREHLSLRKLLKADDESTD
ncbi:MAG: flippase-like domain-containing protein [Deltaproteobacteria bacterium]|nr:flippase-like domain-containing protein [Deltaproteobacteria bacterium]MBF0523685.1 flippase-like domain-containing protein [Deltaproteobacteria bacterium]